MRQLRIRRPFRAAALLALQLVVVPAALGGEAAPAPAAERGNFELRFGGDARLRSFVYPNPGPDNFIDTIVGLDAETIRYRSTFLVLFFENETDMGKGPAEKGIWDPNRGRWTFGLKTRTEAWGHFLEVILRHDCFHGIDRWLPGQDFKMTSEGVGVGSLLYLEKHRFTPYRESSPGLAFPIRLSYYLSPTFYGPKGGDWQRSPYDVRLEANARLDLVRWRRAGLGVESANVFYLTHANAVDRQHALQMNLYVYGTSHALTVFGVWWPYDDQAFRNRARRGAIGLELSI